MPNWCQNELVVKGPEEERFKLVQLWANSEEVFSKILPTPDIIMETDGSIIEEWRVCHWGTKWDVGGEDAPVEIEWQADKTTIRFDTAWDPPLPVICAMSSCFPSLVFYLTYLDQTAGFAGEFQVGEYRHKHYESNRDQEYYRIEKAFRRYDEDLPSGSVRVYRNVLRATLSIVNERWDAFIDGHNPDPRTQGGLQIKELIDQLESALSYGEQE